MNAIKEFISYMEELGAIKPEKAYKDLQWQVETKFGPLEISLCPSDFTTTGKPRKKHSNFCQIYSHFRDSKCIPFLQEYEKKRIITSWKWNHHCSGGENEVENWNYLFQRFKNELGKILV